jgi:ribosomal protein L20A (L18A)
MTLLYKFFNACAIVVRIYSSLIEKHQFKFDSIKIKNFTQAFILTAKHFI